MRVLLDINVLLDVYLNRAEFVADSVEVLRAHREARLDVLLSAVSLPTIFYVARRHAGIDRARLAVAESLVSFEIVPVGRSTLETARTFPGPDFEDNLQVACAVEAHLDAIVTRNPSDYAGSPVPALLPAQILDQIPGQ